MVQHLLHCRYITALLDLSFLCSNPYHLLKPLLQAHRRANLLPVQPYDLQARLLQVRRPLIQKTLAAMSITVLQGIARLPSALLSEHLLSLSYYQVLHTIFDVDGMDKEISAL